MYFTLVNGSSLQTQFKLQKYTLYKSMIKPIWTYGIQLYGTASNSNIEIIQRAQSKIMKTITGAPYYTRNEDLHRDLELPMVKEEIHKITQNFTLNNKR